MSADRDETGGPEIDEFTHGSIPLSLRQVVRQNRCFSADPGIEACGILSHSRCEDLHPRFFYGSAPIVRVCFRLQLLAHLTRKTRKRLLGWLALHR